MERFFTIRFHRNTALRFKQFSRKVSKSYTETLDAMIDFFEWHGFKPSDRFAESVGLELLKNRKRTNASIAIMKDIEKSQNIPLINIETMLQSLFQGEAKRERPKPLPIEKATDSIAEKGISKMKFERFQRKHLETKERLNHVLEKVEFVKNRFGEDYLKLNIEREELARLKQTLKRA